MTGNLISLMILLPLLGAFVQSLVPDRTDGVASSRRSRWIALGSSLGSALIGILAVAGLKTETADIQLAEVVPWIGSYAISYELGVDGLNALLILLISLIFPLLIAAEWSRSSGGRGIHALLLMLQSAFAGAVCAQDLFLQFFFWALTAIPFYFLIGIWGGPNRERAAFHSIVASALGNGLFFAALVLVYYAVEPHTFSIRELMGGKLNAKTFVLLGNEISVSTAAFGLIALGLALRSPVWPIHGWFAEVAAEAPPSVFVAIAAVSIPVATGIFMRVAYSLFPETAARMADGVVVVGVLNLLVGALCATAQRSLRLLLAFICMSELGLLLMGVGSLNQTGVVGAVYQQLVVGLATAGFGLFSGVLLDRTGKEHFVSGDGTGTFGGLAMKAPAMAVVAGVVVASLLGVPGLGGFVSHALLVIGSYSVSPGAVLLAAITVVMATYYLFNMYRFVFLGSRSPEVEGFNDLTFRERAFLWPIVGSLLLFGIYPKPLIEMVRPTVVTLLSTLK